MRNLFENTYVPTPISESLETTTICFSTCHELLCELQSLITTISRNGKLTRDQTPLCLEGFSRSTKLYPLHRIRSTKDIPEIPKLQLHRL
jgi:hypothetical protein